MAGNTRRFAGRRSRWHRADIITYPVVQRTQKGVSGQPLDRASRTLLQRVDRVVALPAVPDHVGYAANHVAAHQRPAIIPLAYMGVVELLHADKPLVLESEMERRQTLYSDHAVVPFAESGRWRFSMQISRLYWNLRQRSVRRYIQITLSFPLRKVGGGASPCRSTACIGIWNGEALDVRFRSRRRSPCKKKGGGAPTHRSGACIMESGMEGEVLSYFKIISSCIQAVLLNALLYQHHYCTEY